MVADSTFYFSHVYEMEAGEPPFSFVKTMRLTSLYGVFPFRYCDGSFRLDLCLAVYSILFSLLFLACGLVIVFSYLLQWTLVTGLPWKLEATAVIIQATLIACNLLCVVANLKKINLAVRLMRRVDTMILGSWRKEGGNSLAAMLEISLPYVLFVTNTSGTMQGTLPFVVQVYRLVVNVTVLSVTGQLTGFLSAVQARFCTLLKLLKDGASTNLVIAYDHLCDASQALGEAYGPQVVLSLFYCFSEIVIQSYFIVVGAKSQFMNFQDLVVKATLVLLSIFVIWRIASSSVNLTGKATEFNNLLYEIMINDKSGTILLNEKLRLHIAMKRENVLIACGLFNLDCTLFHSTVTSATVYLVLLIQLGQPLASDIHTTISEVWHNVSSIPVSTSLSSNGSQLN